MYVSLTDIKKHLNVDHSEDDDYIAELESVAEDSVATYLQVDDLTGYLVPEDGRLKPAVRHAIRLLVGAWYANREDVTFAQPSTLPDGVTALLLPLKQFCND